MLPQPDNELIQRYVKDGDENAFDELYSKYKPKVRAWVRKRLPQKDLAEDLEQEIWMRVSQNLHQYSPDRPFEPWLFTVCRNTSINLWWQNHDRFDWEFNRNLYKHMVQDFIKSEGRLINAELNRLSPKEAPVRFQRIVHILTSNSFQNLRNVKTVDQVEAKVLQETRKALLEYLKQEGTLVVIPPDSPEMEKVAKRLRSKSLSPLDESIQREHLHQQLDRFRSIMQEELTENEQIVVRLRLIEGRETWEIADFFRQILKIPMEYDNVNTIFHRAKIKLAMRLVKDVQEEQLEEDGELMKKIALGRLVERESFDTLSLELNRCASEIEEHYKRFMKKFVNYLEELFTRFAPLLAETGGDLL